MAVKNYLLSRVLVLPILAVVLVSGCIGGGNTVDFGDGVVIQAWEPDFSRLYSDETIQFQLRVQNQGEIDATDLSAKVMGIDTGRDGWDLDVAVGNDKRDLLLAPNPDTNTPGEVWTMIWSGTAPELTRGMENVYSPIVRVSYVYSGSATKTITLVDAQELRRIIQQGSSLPSQPTVATAGPISIEVTTGNYVKTQKEDDPFPINIVLRNNGWSAGGSAIPVDESGLRSPNNYNYPVHMEIEMPSGLRIDSDTCDSDAWYDLWKGETAEITCQVEITDMPGEGERQDKVMKFFVDYGYKIDAQTSVTVVGQ